MSCWLFFLLKDFFIFPQYKGGWAPPQDLPLNTLANTMRHACGSRFEGSKVGRNTVKYTVLFLYSDWLHFLWHGIFLFVKSLAEVKLIQTRALISHDLWSRGNDYVVLNVVLSHTLTRGDWLLALLLYIIMFVLLNITIIIVSLIIVNGLNFYYPVRLILILVSYTVYSVF